jgi:hypothetical protein
VVNLADVTVLEPRSYVWFMAVDTDSDGQPDFSFFDSVLTVIQ